MSKLSRAIKYVIAIWIIALCLAAPQAMQFGVEYEDRNGLQRSRCTVVSTQFYFQHAFEISTFVFFVGPMTLITVLYVLIGLKLRESRLLPPPKKDSSPTSGKEEFCPPRTSRNNAAQKRVIKMLIAVVVAFFICWAPFHAQRLLAVYLSTASPEDQEMFVKLYIVLMYASGVLYFVSTTVNPVLYHIMSKKFREAFKTTFTQICRWRSKTNRMYDKSIYSSLLRDTQSFRKSNVVSKATDNFAINESSSFKDFSRKQEYRHKENNIEKTKSSDVIYPKSTLHNGSFRPRIPSETSQITVLTTLSKSLSSEARPTHQNPIFLGRSISTVDKKPIRFRRQSESRTNNHKQGILNYGMFKLFNRHNSPNNITFLRQGSVESARSATNTISNSSLQDMDESEFNTSELAQYMEEVNNELT